MQTDERDFDENVEGDDADRRRNERSTIEFPYGDLDGAVALCRLMYDSAGTSAEHDRLAALLGLVASAGGYRSRIAPARTFGLIVVEKGRVELTELGEAIVDPSREKISRVEAFLKVPLYAAVFEKFKGKQLPLARGLENEMVNLGVSSKQADKARQAFERSAEQAGFFALGRDRLVKPQTERLRDFAANTKPVDPKNIRQNNESNETRFEFLMPLLNRLPMPDSEFPYDARLKWLVAAANLFDVIYTATGDEHIDIRRRRQNEGAA